YTFDKFKKTKKISYQLRRITFNITNRRELTSSKCALQHGIAIAAGIKAAKDLANMPPNICNSAYLASKAHELANSNKHINASVLGKQQMKELGMNAYLAVGQGSANESLMSIIEYQGHLDSKARPIVLVGKGLTFDSGGISIKPSNKMNEMKYDMCGAATVYGVMRVVLSLNLPLNIIGVLAGCENMVDSCSFRPGDVLTTLSGQTVEVLNTDAEGRLVLCDTLTYIERFNPEIVIDIATLTGACVIALGHHFTGMMSNHNPLSNELSSAAEQAGDYIWPLPLSNEFHEELDSHCADMTNVGGSAGGAITAGCFLSRFTSKYHWAHLDIAGTAWNTEKHQGATGRPVAMLSQFLINRSISDNK
ncbi:MAG: leucyl aminopeptidase, partial [Candidatus Baumannia cicadellinicola]|nr:leucyl aminopeptidase [Candidatus Baumannia cicadellinicola]